MSILGVFLPSLQLAHLIGEDGKKLHLFHSHLHARGFWNVQTQNTAANLCFFNCVEIVQRVFNLGITINNHCDDYF